MKSNKIYEIGEFLACGILCDLPVIGGGDLSQDTIKD